MNTGPVDMAAWQQRKKKVSITIKADTVLPLEANLLAYEGRVEEGRGEVKDRREESWLDMHFYVFVF